MAADLKAKASICPRCKAEFVCRADDIQLCQCWGVSLSEEERENIRQAGYSEAQASCLCRQCLLTFKSSKGV